MELDELLDHNPEDALQEIAADAPVASDLDLDALLNEGPLVLPGWRQPLALGRLQQGGSSGHAQRSAGHIAHAREARFKKRAVESDAKLAVVETTAKTERKRVALACSHAQAGLGVALKRGKAAHQQQVYE